MKMNVAIYGAAGYGGGELLRWLNVHPHVQIKCAISETMAGHPVSAAFPGLSKRVNSTFSDGKDATELEDCKLVFLARGNGIAMGQIQALLAKGLRVIDLSADFRFRNPEDYHTWYGVEHTSPILSKSAVYGLPELHREEIKSANVVGNPGCYSTASILALAPAAKHGLIDLSSIVVDGKSGLSGAGRSKFGLDTHYSEVNESVKGYKAGGTHRHTGELEQELGALAGAAFPISFTPHLVPMTRGILVSAYAKLNSFMSAETILELYSDFYKDEPFVDVVTELPASKNTSGSNLCQIGLAVDSRTQRLTVFSVIDNLGKGMVGQAIQNMNIMFGFEETAGLTMPGMWP